jgi:hypothetical protein
MFHVKHERPSFMPRMIASPSDTLSASAGKRMAAEAKIPATPSLRTRGSKSLNASAGFATARAQAQTWRPKSSERRAASCAVSVRTSQSRSRTRTHSSRKAALRGRGQTGPRTDVDGRSRRQRIDQRAGSQGIGNMTLLKAGEVSGSHQIEARCPPSHQGRILGQTCGRSRVHDLPECRSACFT